MRALQLLLACSYFITFCHSNGISIVGPSSIHPNRIFTVIITNSYPSSDVTLRLSLTNEDNHVVANRQDITDVVRRKSVKPFKFKVGNIPEGKYLLDVQNSGGSISFRKTIDLEYVNRTLSIFIQTDKPVYKPGDLFRFRIVIIDIDAMPVLDLKSLVIDIKDAGENTIKHWPRAKLHNGVFESAMMIPGSPALGDWTIEVSANDGFLEQRKVQHFYVKEYVLPTFIVDAVPSELLLIANQKIALTIKAFYTFGDPVKGRATVDLHLPDGSKRPDHSISKSIKGSSQVEFDLKQEIELSDDENKFEMVKVNLTVVEDFSNRVVNRTFNIPVYATPFGNIASEASEDPENSRVKRFKIVVKDHNERAVCCHLVKLIVILHVNRVNIIREGTLNTKGEVSFEFQTPESLQNMDFKANIGPAEDVDLEPEIQGSEAASDENENQSSSDPITIGPRPISGKLPTPHMNRDFSFIVWSTFQMTHIWYVVINQDNVLLQKFLAVKNAYKYTLKIHLTPAMAPKSKIIVFTTKDNVLHHNYYEIKFNTFRNSFKFSTDASDYLPNQEMALVTDAEKDSYVAYHAIDASALHVGPASPFNGFGFTKQDVLDELDRYLHSDNQLNLIGSLGYFLESSSEIGQGSSRLQRFGKPDSPRRAILLRTDFPEVFLWQNFSMQRKPSQTTYKRTPDSITSWQLTGFALSPTAGLGIMDDKVEFVVKKPFYIIANLPYSIKRKEITRIQVTIFSSLQTTATTDVWLYSKNDEIEFIDQSSSDPTRRKKSIMVPGNYAEQTSFLIKAKKLGEIAIKIEAKNGLASDGIERTLLVTPESHRFEENIPRFIEHDSYSSKNHTIKLNIPQNPDEGSVNITLSVNGQVLDPVMDNLQSLFQKPTGCGEQSMLKFVPNVVVLDYLEESGNNDPELKTKAINYLEEGYANQLKYRLKDGSFSVFEHSKGGTFLTAFVAKSFKIADKYMKVNRTIVEEAFAWLASIQDSDGLFPEVGDVYHIELQGGLYNKKISLSAFVAIAFLETEDIAQKYRSVIDKTITHLVANLGGMNHYELALATYALTLSNHAKKGEAMKKLIDASELDDTGAMRYWDYGALSVETSSYGLLSYLEQGHELDAVSVAKWLISQRKSRGEFSGTQATFVGLKALAKISAKITADRNDYTVTVRQKNPDDGWKTSFGITRYLGKILPEQLPSRGRVFSVEIDGHGYGFFQVSYSYNHNIQLAKKAFDIQVERLPQSTQYKHHMKVCTKFLQPERYTTSNMALVEVFFPSGFEVDEGSLDDLGDNARGIKKIERRDAGTSVVVYYNSLDTQYRCFTISASRVHLIARQLPSHVIVYDYDNDNHFGIATYEAKTLEPCDICDPSDCRAMLCP